MIKQQQYLTMKFNSDRLDKFEYDIKVTVEEAVQNRELIAIFENQIIDSINKIVGRKTNVGTIKEYKREIEDIQSLPTSVENGEKISELQAKINQEMFIPEYITIKIDKKTHYRHMFKNGVKINGVKFVRFNSSASQARVNTVLFVAEPIFEELRRVTDNGRNLEVEISPAKLNAYRGLYCSSRFKVSTPRFCVIKDYESPCEVEVNFITETGKNEDDHVEKRKFTKDFNRFDGQGLITPAQAKKWASELELDYMPAQFCIRGSFLKGMVCVMDIHKFMEEENNGDYFIESIYKDEDGKSIMVDLREIDVVITESMLKLWDSWDSEHHYQKCCEENDLGWGVTLFTPEFDKTFFYENYQFLQTLNLDDNDVNNITKKFIDWVQGVTSENIYYTMLFLTGMEADENKFKYFLKNTKNYWVKALILQPELIKDKYIRGKLYNLLKKKIKSGAIGKIIVDGNFQVIVSDPYAMLEAMCGKKVKGLLKQGEYYSSFWNNRNEPKVVASRSPLTYRSEHVIMNLIQNEKTEEWFKYCYTGIILNVHGDDTDRFAGSDFDYDIIATTSDKSVLKGVYKEELPVVYDAPKPSKKIPIEQDLYNSDLFSFDSIIGSLTNKSTTGYALLANYKEGTKEHEVLLKRIKSITKAQSAQIDKTKIGKNVKGIVPKWIKYSTPKVNEDGEILETEEERIEREFNNSILMDKHPYFFIHLYKNTMKNYKNHIKQYEILSLQRLGISLEELKSKERNSEEQEFYNEFYRRSPVIESDCVMNKICRKMESVDFGIRELLKVEDDNGLHKLFLNETIDFNEDIFKEVINSYKIYQSEIRGLIITAESEGKNAKDIEVQVKTNLTQNAFKEKLNVLCSNSKELTNYIVKMFYEEHPSYNKDVMWSLFGKEITDNIMDKISTIKVPCLDEEGELEYLNNYYSIKEVLVDDIK